MGWATRELNLLGQKRDKNYKDFSTCVDPGEREICSLRAKLYLLNNKVPYCGGLCACDGQNKRGGLHLKKSLYIVNNELQNCGGLCTSDSLRREEGCNLRAHLIWSILSSKVAEACALLMASEERKGAT